MIRPPIIEEKIPLKQGLKHSGTGTSGGSGLNWREDSIKTRIETFLKRLRLLILPDWREDSIKTRIETLMRSQIFPITHKIEEKIPLKQGLKQKEGVLIFWNIIIEEKIPLKQGLKRIGAYLADQLQLDWREDSIKTRIETNL